LALCLFIFIEYLKNFLGGKKVMAISEKIELLGTYTDIPNELTLTNISTLNELDYVGAEDFDQTMLENILPTAITEKINFESLLEIDYQWICRCLRILNFGPYHTTNAIFCGKCSKTSYGEYRVNLNTIDCKPLPDKFVNQITLKKDMFLDFNGDVVFKLPTIRQMINAYKDKAFQTKDGRVNRKLARMCYMISSIKTNKNLTPIEIKIIIENEFSRADYLLLGGEIADKSDYGLRAGGSAQCPNCGNLDGTYLALTDDRFFRPTLGDIREWKHDRSQGQGENISRDKAANV